MASTLSDVELDEELEEDEDEEEDERIGESTGILCGCGDEEFVRLREDVAVVHLAYPYASHEGEIYYSLILLDDGEPVVEPLIFRYECWENIGQELAEAVEDAPPWEEPGAVLFCDYCSSSIRMGEKCATVHLGEIDMSERDRGTTTFVPAVDEDNNEEDPYIICLPCVRLMVSSTIDRFEVFQLWEDLVSQNDECMHCTNAHCWRIGRCPCKCHVVPR